MSGETAKMAQDVEDSRNEFDTAVENGSWPETWDSSKGQEFLVRFLIGRGWTLEKRDAKKGD